jgi:hypothetical protein
MSVQRGLLIALMSQLVFFSLVVVTQGFERMICFGLFWISTLATLLALVSCKRWDAAAWLAFGAFGATTIVAVLISSNAVSDIVGIAVPVLCLLFVAAINVALPQRRLRHHLPFPAAPRSTPQAKKVKSNLETFFVAHGSRKYHRAACRMLKNKPIMHAFATEKEARAGMFSPCSVCKQ